MFEDQAMLNLGVLLEDQDPVAAKDLAKSERNNLFLDAGVCNAHIVDSCLTSKETNQKPPSQADKIYRKLVVPLQVS